MNSKSQYYKNIHFKIPMGIFVKLSKSILNFILRRKAWGQPEFSSRKRSMIELPLSVIKTDNALIIKMVCIGAEQTNGPLEQRKVFQKHMPASMDNWFITRIILRSLGKGYIFFLLSRAGQLVFHTEKRNRIPYPQITKNHLPPNKN